MSKFGDRDRLGGELLSDLGPKSSMYLFWLAHKEWLPAKKSFPYYPGSMFPSQHLGEESLRYQSNLDSHIGKHLVDGVEQH